MWATARVQTTLVRAGHDRARVACLRIPLSFLTTRTFAISNGTCAAAATAPSSVDVGPNDGYTK